MNWETGNGHGITGYRGVVFFFHEGWMKRAIEYIFLLLFFGVRFLFFHLEVGI